MIVRLFVWSLFDSKTTIDELRAHLPELEPPSAWLWNGAGERFGLIAYGDRSDEISVVSLLVGREPDLGEEFDVV